MLAEGLAGFIGIPGLKQLTPEEQTIRQNSALAKAYSLVGNQPGYKANPTARTYADLDPRDEQVANWNTLSASERQRLLRDPEVRDQLLDKLALQLHNTQGKGKSNPNPFMRAKGSTTDRSPATSAAQAKAKAQDYQQAMLMIRRMQASADAVQARQKR